MSGRFDPRSITTWLASWTSRAAPVGEPLPEPGRRVDVPELAGPGQLAAGGSAKHLFGEERLRGEVEPLQRDGQCGEIEVFAAVLELAAVDQAEFDRLVELDAETLLVALERAEVLRRPGPTSKYGLGDASGSFVPGFGSALGSIGFGSCSFSDCTPTGSSGRTPGGGRWDCAGGRNQLAAVVNRAGAG